MKIYDCFTFYNELDLLEIRLSELYDYVDHFVLVEADRTFQNKSKPFYYFENKERFSQWQDKIIHIRVTDMPDGSDPWIRETHQRNKILSGIESASPEDIIIISDCDEIVRSSVINNLRTTNHLIYPMRMPLFNFKFNYMRVNPGGYDVWAMAARYSILKNVTPDQLRNARFSYFNFPLHGETADTKLIEHAGWHFGYLGDIDYLRDKAQSFSHSEVNRPDFLEQLDIDASIQERKEWDRSQAARYEIVELNDYFPQTVLDNKEKYIHFILEGIQPPTDFLPH
jgi:hypothetical protein